jgi:hypothetical protein
MRQDFFMQQQTPSKKIRLLIATQYLNAGGVGRQIQYMVRYLDATRFDIHLAVFCEKDLFFTDLLQNARVQAHVLASTKLNPLRTWWSMVWLCQRLQPDIVHLMGGKANHIGGFINYFLRATAVLFSVRSANNRRLNHLL